MKSPQLLETLKRLGVTDAHFEAGLHPIVRRGGKLSFMENIGPLNRRQIADLVSGFMTTAQRKAFAQSRSISFSTETSPKFQISFSRMGAREFARIKDLSEAAPHPSLQKPPTKRHWVRLTRVCNDRCVFCLDKEAQNGTNVPFEAIMENLDRGRKKGLTRVVLSGGEPTIHPRYVDIVRETKRKGYTHIQTVTNGRRLCYEPFMKAAVEAGLNEITFSLHGPNPAIHDRQSGSPGSFAQGVVALRRALKVPGLIVSVDIVISRINIRHLRETMEFFINEGVREFDLLQVIPFGSAWRNRGDLFYDVEAELPHLHRALDLSKRGDIVLWTNRLPTRYLEGYEDLIQPPSKLHDEYAGRGEMFEEFLRSGKKPDCWGRCAHCFLEKPCADIAGLNAKKSLDAYPTPPCLADHAETILNRDSQASSITALEHRDNLSMKDFVDFFILNRYFIKGKACRNCRFDSECAGAHVEHVRRYGFPKPEASMLVTKVSPTA
ncbi:MAG: radical SAM protein [Elusimicrobia bacterium]|nr:radical SAM protein [Elusimicrobiota bacterium]